MGKAVRKKQENFVWLSYADLSTGIMISFILILITFIDLTGYSLDRVKAKNKFDEINRRIVHIIADKKACNNAKIEVRPGQSDSIQVLFLNKKNSWFPTGESTLYKHAKSCLESFGQVWLEEMFKESEGRKNFKIKHLIIEGHTNSDALSTINRIQNKIKRNKENFKENLELSQKRALETTKYLIENIKHPSKELKEDFEKWKIQKLSGNGRSYQDRIYKLKANIRNKENLECITKPEEKEYCEEDKNRSKRVEFKYVLESVK